MISAFVDALLDSPSIFVETVCYRDRDNIPSDVLDHEGNVILVSPNKSHGRGSYWRAIYEASTDSDTDVCFVVPYSPMASGTISIIEDEIDRSPIPGQLWGVERNTERTLEFENGSSIKTIATDGLHGEDAVRGYAPDYLLITDFPEEGEEFSDELREKTLPLLIEHAENVWVEQTTFGGPIADELLSRGVFVKQLDR